jgi:hypothetical protein
LEVGTSNPSKSPKLGGFRGALELRQMQEFILSFSNALNLAISREAVMRTSFAF